MQNGRNAPDGVLRVLQAVRFVFISHYPPFPHGTEASRLRYEMRRHTCVLRALNSSKYAAYFPTPHHSHMEKCSSAISTVPKARENSAEWAKRTRRRTPCTSSGAFGFHFLTTNRSHMEKKQVGCCYEMRRRTCVLRALNSSKIRSLFSMSYISDYGDYCPQYRSRDYFDRGVP